MSNPVLLASPDLSPPFAVEVIFFWFLLHFRKPELVYSPDLAERSRCKPVPRQCRRKGAERLYSILYCL